MLKTICQNIKNHDIPKEPQICYDTNPTIHNNPAKEVATTQLNYGVFDNLHWAGDKLITAGSRTKNCGETMTYECLKDYHITTIHPDNLAITPLYQGKYTQDFSGVSTVLPVGKTYYLGSFYRDKMAYFEGK